MPRYMLDADSVSYALRGQGQVAKRLLEHQPSDLCISAITLAELSFGAEAKRSQKIRRAIRSFTKDVAVVPFDEASAERFGVVAAALADSRGANRRCRHTRGRPGVVLGPLSSPTTRGTSVACPALRSRTGRSDGAAEQGDEADER